MAGAPESLTGRILGMLRRRTRADEPDTEIELYGASQWRLMWLKFKRHRLATIGGTVVVMLYLMAVFNQVIAPYSNTERSGYPFAPPNRIHFFDEGSFRPYVYGIQAEPGLGAMQRRYVRDESVKYRVNFFTTGRQYEILGFIPSSFHLFQVEEGGHVFLFGTDSIGRDIFSRTLSGATISLSIGMVGVVVSFVLGALIGGFSGYYGGTFDNIAQRSIEFLIAIPTIPLWMALSAAVPRDWSALQVYFAITVILSIQGWTAMARVVRGRLLQLREEDFVLDAHLGGASDLRVVVVHMLPAFMSFLIVQLTLAIPAMILGETALSFLGLGLREPVVSWGVLIQDAQNVRTVLDFPWQLIPGAFVIVTVLAFNFFGDGLRDAADPYKT